ncbi:LytR/AlgR family response regulator transcription factor [Dyella flagellata]|uniref:DNA-binding response regulator n=1 Tax=Dyella flagellata TaxID=1867833 RepID=A0ABQ5X9K2_9GAMM|nr:LytTR family DNA-binding domain-containing protein [Dyella flagellata]GLQ88265.1 DNA-binding response regulator [Dyella flagellata]
MTTALIADDEPLLRGALAQMLAQAWPELQVAAQARNGREAIKQFDAIQPDVCFLDVHMPGVSGVDVAHHIGRRAHVVFVTAYDKYAVQAFAQGVLDYLVKPVEPARLAETVARLKERLRMAQPASNTEALLRELATQLERRASPPSLRWIRAQVGQTLRLIPVDDIVYLRSEAKYTLIAWRGEAGQACEALISSTLKELITQLDAAQFVQVHRSVVVNLRAISHITRGGNETASVHLKDRKEQLPVSRSYLHLFRQM